MSENKPLVSVLMTSYNREKYIVEAIESIIKSSYKNLELIIVDDCSKDQTVAIANSYAVKDERIKVFVNEQNLGDYPNRNKAASYATGKYLKYVDADDMIYPHCLEVMVCMMEQFPGAGYGICPKQQDKEFLFPILLGPEDAYRYHYFKKVTIFNRAPLSTIILRDAFDAIGGFTGKRMIGDFEMWHRLSLKFPVVVMPTGLVWYRVHNEQETSHRQKFFLDALTVAEDCISKSLLTEVEKDFLITKLRRNMFIKLIKNPMNMSFRSRWNYFKNSSIKLVQLIRSRGQQYFK